MGTTKHLGLLFIRDKKGPPGRGLFRIYVKNWSHHDYPGVPDKHVYLMPPASSFDEIQEQLDFLAIELALLRLSAKEKHGESD